MLDRVLLILLILLLPIGIIASRVMSGELSIGGNGITNSQEKKIEALVTMLTQQASQQKGPATTTGTFNITGVVYASDSGTLRLGGMAPDAQGFIWIWKASTKTNKTVKKTASPSAIPDQLTWDGPMVVRPQNGSGFDITVPVNDMAGIVEIRLEQGQSSGIVRYDLDNRKQLQ